jgi:hypothetical protein
VELKQCTSGSVFGKILDVNQEHLADGKVAVQELADSVSWTYRMHAGQRRGLAIQYPWFVAVDFLCLLIQHWDSGLLPGSLFGPLDILEARQSLLKDPWKINISWCGSFAALGNQVAHMAIKFRACNPACDNCEIDRKAAVESLRKAIESKHRQILLSHSPVCGVLGASASSVFGAEDLVFLEPAWLTSSCLCSEYGSPVFCQVQNPVGRAKQILLGRD